MEKSIVLCGFMASGKTTVGKRLATKLCYNFLDTDLYLVEKTGETIPQIFDRGGESLFRDLEHQVAREVCAMPKKVIATGGGLMTYPRNVELFSEKVLVVYLKESFATCYSRLENSGRPIVSTRTREQMEALYQQRTALYAQAAHLQLVCQPDPGDTAGAIAEYFLKYLQDGA